MLYCRISLVYAATVFLTVNDGFEGAWGTKIIEGPNLSVPPRVELALVVLLVLAFTRPEWWRVKREYIY